MTGLVMYLSELGKRAVMEKSRGGEKTMAVQKGTVVRPNIVFTL
jgi:hypothetical protein